MWRAAGLRGCTTILGSIAGLLKDHGLCFAGAYAGRGCPIGNSLSLSRRTGSCKGAGSGFRIALSGFWELNEYVVS